MGDDSIEKKKKKSSSSTSKHGDKERKHRSSKSKREKGEDGKDKERKHRSSKSKREKGDDKDGKKKKKKHRSSKSKSKTSSSSSSKKKRKEKTVEEAQKEIEEEMADSGEEGDEVITVFEDKYTVGDELGRGAFSIVKLVTSKRSGRKYAVKIIEKKDVGQDMARLRTEIEILTRVKHPNIINLKEIMEDDHTLFIITEMVTGGELFDKIVELGAYTEADAASLVSKIVRAIDYLHDMGIVHRDLKPENLLLKNPNDMSEVKLADFGLSKIVASGATAAMMQTACGTPGYVAPEVLTADGYDKEVDLWSIGVITYILLCGFPPFYNEHLPNLFEQIMKADYDYPADYWDDISETAKNFIDRLLVVDPARRMTTKQALEHPWLLGNAPDKKLKMNMKMADYVNQYREASRANLKADAPPS